MPHFPLRTSPLAMIPQSRCVEMGDAGNRRRFVQLGHNLGALLKGEGVVFVLAVRGLEDELALTGDVPKLPEGGNDERLSSG
ncbi:MAG TPA: hypothetical protein VIS96_06005 [Terrimicrobiaceae bacterium]